MAQTPSQRAAVLYDSHLILFAGPGSGKTSTSVAKGERILTSPDAHLGMVTFTTAGAEEMRSRLAAAFLKRGATLPKYRFLSGTFHSIALRHFQRHSHSTKKLLSPPARAGMISGMLGQLDFETRGEFTLALEKYQGALHQDCSALDPDIQAFILAYHERLNSINAMDLATMIRECALGMRSGSIPLLPLTHLIGDEMQDADQVQLELMLIHAHAGITTTLVADDDQTIYEWRSALGYEGLMHFARETGAKTITLAENFRSRSEIVSHAQDLIRRNDPTRIDKNPHAVRGPGGRVGYVVASHIEQECKNIANALNTCTPKDGICAILGRSNRDLDAMESAIVGCDPPIPYQRDGQSIWQTPEIQVFLCLLRALLHGHTADLVSVLSLLPIDLQTRMDLERQLGGSCGTFLEGEVPELQSGTELDRKELIDFTTVTSYVRTRLRRGEIAMAIPTSGSEVRRLLKARQRAKPRQIDALIDVAESVLQKLIGSLSNRLATLARMQAADASAAVRLMTMHSSKGLEFETVFLLNASAPDDGSTLIEDQPERRLFYVGMTRAKDNLVVSFNGRAIKYIGEAGLTQSTSIRAILLP